MVLPWVPATASDCALAQIDASMPARLEHGHPGGSCLVEFDVPFGNRRRCGHRVDAVDEGAVVTDVHLDAGGTDPFEHRMVAEIGTRHDVPHLGERDGDRAHARTADTDHVEAVGDRQLERWAWWWRRRNHPVPQGAPVRVSERELVRVSMPVASAAGRHDGDDAIATRSIKPAKAPERCTSPRRRAAAARHRDETGRRGGRRACRRAGRVRSLAAWIAPSTSGQPPPHVVGLVVVGRGCPRHQDRRRAGDGDLVDRAGAAADDHVAGLVHARHVGLVADHLVHDGAVDVGDALPRTARR